jgi:hypothetical protein
VAIGVAHLLLAGARARFGALNISRLDARGYDLSGVRATGIRRRLAARWSTS